MSLVFAPSAPDASKLSGVSKPKNKTSAEGAIIARAREALGLTQKQLAKLAGVSRPTIARIETGSTEWMRPDLLDKVAPVLGLTTADIKAGRVQFADPVAALADYMASPFAQIDQPTGEEQAWLRAMPPYVWAGMARPSPKTISLLIAFRRSGKGAQ